MIISLLIVAVVIIIALAIYAFTLTQKVKAQTVEQEEKRVANLEKEKETVAKKTEFIVDSLHAIAQTVIKEDLNLSEAAIRISVLLDNLTLDDARKTAYKSFFDLNEKVKDYETHDARKAMNKMARFKQDIERETFEREHREFILTACEQVRVDKFEGIFAV
jgi:hypothetical protein